jgi:hypothetical protein
VGRDYSPTIRNRTNDWRVTQEINKRYTAVLRGGFFNFGSNTDHGCTSNGLLQVAAWIDYAIV